jgi:hypothetical protein
MARKNSIGRQQSPAANAAKASPSRPALRLSQQSGSSKSLAQNEAKVMPPPQPPALLPIAAKAASSSTPNKAGGLNKQKVYQIGSTVLSGPEVTISPSAGNKSPDNSSKRKNEVEVKRVASPNQA